MNPKYGAKMKPYELAPSMIPKIQTSPIWTHHGCNDGQKGNQNTYATRPKDGPNTKPYIAPKGADKS